MLGKRNTTAVLATVWWSVEQKAAQDEDSVMQGYVGLTYGHSTP